MNELTIYNVYVEMNSQEQCDRMKQLCIDNNLPIWDHEMAFKFEHSGFEEFSYGDGTEDFYIGLVKDSLINKTKVTEQEFINLLKQTKR